MEQRGISLVAEFGGRVYLRKNESDGPLELYTENKDIDNQARKRYIHFISIGLGQFTLGIVFLVRMLTYAEEKNAPFWVTLIFGIAFVIAGITLFVKGVFGQKKHSIKNDEKNIWQ